MLKTGFGVQLVIQENLVDGDSTVLELGDEKWRRKTFSELY